MCFSSRYSIEKGNASFLFEFYINFNMNYIYILDLLTQFGKNMTNTYNEIIRGINILMSLLRDEENERMPRIFNALNGLVKEIKIIKSKSEFIMNEMLIVEEKFKTFQNNIQDAFSQIITKSDKVLNVYKFFFNLMLLVTDSIFTEFKTCCTAC